MLNWLPTLGASGSNASRRTRCASAHALADQDLRGSASAGGRTGSQLIVATHSETLLNVADPASIRVVGSGGIVRAKLQATKDALRLTNSEVAAATATVRGN